MKSYLPLGSVVLLKGGKKRIMIYGRRQKAVETGKIWDYIGCPYPEGNIDANFMYLFNNEQIEQIYFIGFQDPEEIEFSVKLGEMK